MLLTKHASPVGQVGDERGSSLCHLSFDQAGKEP
jgi:hypothetical protein